MNSTCYIKKIVNCAIEQKSPTKCRKVHLNIIHIENALYKCITIPIPNSLFYEVIYEMFHILNCGFEIK